MIVFPVIIVLLALLSNASAQNGTSPRKLTSTFKGILYYDLRLVEHPENLTEENKTKAQTDVCKQLTYMVPWYRPQRNISNCTIVRTDRNWISVNYTISVTEEFLQTNDPQCSTYYILLANLVRRSKAFLKKFYIQHITLENGKSGQPASPSSGDNGSTTIGVDGPVKISSGWVRRAGFVLNDRVTREVHDNVKKQIAEFLHLSNISDNSIHTKPFGVYEDPEYKGYTRMKVNITIENSMPAANHINYTCSSFKQLIKACLNSRFFHSETTYIGWPVTLIDEKSDGSLPTETTQSEAPTQASTEDDSKVKDSTSTQGGGDGKSDESTITTNNGSVVTTSTTIPGGVGKVAFRYSSIIPHMFVVFTLAGWL